MTSTPTRYLFIKWKYAQNLRLSQKQIAKWDHCSPLSSLLSSFSASSALLLLLEDLFRMPTNKDLWLGSWENGDDTPFWTDASAMLSAAQMATALPAANARHMVLVHRMPTVRTKQTSLPSMIAKESWNASKIKPVALNAMKAVVLPEIPLLLLLAPATMIAEQKSTAWQEPVQPLVPAR